MTTATKTPPVTGFIPEWTFGDRLRKARECLHNEDGSRVTIEQMAALVHASKSAAGSWELDDHRPSINTVRAWAIVTGVDQTWLAGDAYDERGRRVTGGKQLSLFPESDEVAAHAETAHATVHRIHAPPTMPKGLAS